MATAYPQLLGVKRRPGGRGLGPDGSGFIVACWLVPSARFAIAASGYQAGVAARQRQGEARIGCSGWQYRDWRGVVYPSDLRSRDWFGWYADHFDTVELNSTFYRLPRAEVVEGWAAAAPEGFTFAVKVGAFGTHRMKLRDPHRWLANHLDRVRRLGPSLGPNLVQLPPRWRRDTGRLDEFLAAAPADLRWAVEVRDASWLHDDVYEVLHRHGAALVVHDLLPGVPRLVTANFVYLRFHGPDARRTPYHGSYGPRRLWRWERRCRAWLGDGLDVYAYFNNDWHGSAVTDATWLRDALARGPAGNAWERATPSFGRHPPSRENRPAGVKVVGSG